MPALVCREDALATVTGALNRPPALVLIEGEAGIGKTRLVQECLWSGRWPERTVLMVHCKPVAETMPLGPVVDGLRRLRAELGFVELSPLGGALRPLFPEWEADLPPPPEQLEEAGARRHRLYRALAELVDRLGVDLLVLEDAHWADTGSLDWLLVAGEAWSQRRSVVVTYRPQSVPAASPVLRRLSSGMPPGMGRARVVLEPLDVAGIQQLTAAMFRTEGVSREFAEFVYERSGGLPLAVEECLKLLRDRGEIARQNGQWGRKELAQMQQVPPNVRDSVLARIEWLDPAARQVLEAAAVLGEPADDRLLATVAGLDPAQAKAGVATGFRAGMLRGAGKGQVAFRHQLAAEAVEAEILASERPGLHQRAGEALQAAGEPSVAKLAHHFREAGDTNSWARYTEAAADLAVEAGNDQAAVTVLHELLTCVDHPGARLGRLARKLGEAAANGAASLGDHAEPVMDALRQAIARGGMPSGERGAIRLLLARLLRWHGQREAADSQVEAAVPDLDDRPELACWAMMNLGIAFSRDWPVSCHLDWIERATARFSQIESATEQLHLAAMRVSALIGLGEEEGWSAAARLPQVGSSKSEQRMILLSMVDVGRLAIKWGRYAEASTRLRNASEGIRAAGYERTLAVTRTGSAYLAWYTGRWAGLGETVAELAEAEATEPSVRVEAHEIQGLLDLATGARDAARQRLTATLEAHARSAPLGHQAATTAGALGRLRLGDGTAEQAVQVTAPVVARIARKGLWLWATDVIWVHLEALAGTGELGQAEELAGQFAGWLANRDAPAPAAAGVLCQGIVTQARGDLEAAAELFARAANAWAALPRPYDELVALERRGQCLLAAGATSRGLRVLSQARQRLLELGARWDADRIAQLLREIEVRRDARGKLGRYGERLTPRERDVLAMVAQGMTNRDVARALFLSPRTVGNHLGRAMRKLQASTRTGAAMAAVDAGLIPSTRETPEAATHAQR